MNKSIYSDISERTQGDIYIGVVGPVRSGKSTLIKRFMDTLVIPNISDDFQKERAKDELPQSAAGRTIMTTEPKFIPENAIELNMEDGIRLKVRMIDCVGYIVPSSEGYIEESQPRMVMTPWYEEEIPFNMAAEIGTEKVMTDHKVITILGCSFSIYPIELGTIYPTQSISLTFMTAPSPRSISTASSGMNFGSVVIIVLPAADCGSSSTALSRMKLLLILGITRVSINFLMKVDFPVLTGPATPI